MPDELLKQLLQGDTKVLARVISLVENEVPGYTELLKKLPFKRVPVIGITGPPGAGKSTLTDGLIKELVEKKCNVAVVCIDPSSPFNRGALLGDRIRMSNWYTHPQVFIRSLATRGSLGGLHAKIIEITDILKAAPFDYILIETVGVGQSEIEIAGLADVTVVVLVPEGGDEIQTMKAGLMEIADIFVVNKSDRPDADAFVKNVRQMLAPAFFHQKIEIPIIKTIATQHAGVAEVLQKIEEKLNQSVESDKRFWLLAQRAYYLIQQHRMKDIDREELFEQIKKHNVTNLYLFLQQKGFLSN